MTLLMVQLDAEDLVDVKGCWEAGTMIKVGMVLLVGDVADLTAQSGRSERLRQVPLLVEWILPRVSVDDTAINLDGKTRKADLIDIITAWLEKGGASGKKTKK
jgi:hypothetical protein